MKETTLNTIPVLTWNWLKMNQALIEDELKNEINFTDTSFEILSKPENVKIISKNEFKTELPEPKDAVFDRPEETGINYKQNCAAGNEKLPKAVSEGFFKASAETLILEASEKTEEPVVILLKPNGKTYSEQIIHALSGSEINVILVSESDENTGIDFIRTKCYAEENSRINLYKVQLLSNGFFRIDSTQNAAADNAKITFTELQLGSGSVYTGVYTNLNGYQAKYSSDTAYFRKGNQKIDMNYVTCHHGSKTECSMKVNGALNDESSKTYRGTIDFRRGCSGSKGNETEETLLLNPKTVNKSIPIILCDEEDVEGEHGATIGRLSSDVLFYMNAHCISEEEACRIMSKAKVQAVADKIPSEEIREKIFSFMNKIF